MELQTLALPLLPPQGERGWGEGVASMVSDADNGQARRRGKRLHPGTPSRMRREPTKAELRFWHHEKDRGIGGLKFRRQVAVGPYIADFLCAEERLIVEIDGGQHGDGRDVSGMLSLKGRWAYRVLRFWNHDVLRDMSAVADTILAERPPHPALPPVGERNSRCSALSPSPSPPHGGEGWGEGVRVWSANLRKTKKAALAGGLSVRCAGRRSRWDVASAPRSAQATIRSSRFQTQ